MPDKPNILWICTDQQRFDTLGCYGNPFVTTPHIDRLASEGVLFENAFCQNPVCTPSRASFLTGRYPRTTRCRQNGQSIPEDERILPRILKDEGYVSGLSGKLHLSACMPTVCPGTERRIDDGYDIFHWSHDVGRGWPTNEYFLWQESLGVEVGTKPSPLSDYIVDGFPAEYHQTKWCADRAIDFMSFAKGRKMPWLFSVNIYDPHHSFDPPAEYLAPYLERLDEIPLPNYEPGELESKPLVQRQDHVGAYAGHGGYPYDKMSERDHRLVRAAYWAMCDQIDANVGRMLDALEETGQRENTIVIFMSDHGEMLGDHGIYLKGAYFYEGACHVPLIVSWPGEIAPRRCADLVELTDIAPTLLDAVAARREPGMQGSSLWPSLAGEGPVLTGRDDVFSEYLNSNFRHTPRAYCSMVRTAEHKLVSFHGIDEGELYDLTADPAERRNLWADPAHTELKLTMLKRLCDRLGFCADPLPQRYSAW